MQRLYTTYLGLLYQRKKHNCTGKPEYLKEGYQIEIELKSINQKNPFLRFLL